MLLSTDPLDAKPVNPAPLVLLALLWLAGIVAGFYYPSLTGKVLNPYIYFLGFLLFVLLFLLCRDKFTRQITLLVLVFALGYLRSGGLSIFPDNHIHKILSISDPITQEIEVRITREPQLRRSEYGNSYRIFGELIRMGEHPVKGKVILSFPDTYLVGDPENLIDGNRIRTYAELTSYRNSRGFSRIPAPYFNTIRNESAVGRARSLVYADSLYVRTSGFRTGYSYQIARMRRFLNRRIEARISERDIPFVKAILLGSREEMGEMRDLLAAGGMAHLIAISGIHLAIISFILLTFLKLLWIRRTPARILMIIFFIIYGELCYWTPSISRAALMLSLLMICGILQRKPSYNNILAFSLIIITALTPLQIFSIGMQFSFISVFVLINILPLFDRKLGMLFKKRSFLNLTGYRLSQLLLTTLLITLFLIPLNLYYFNQFSLNGLIGNLSGIPLLTIIIPLALVLIIIPPVELLIISFGETFRLAMTLFTGWSSYASSLPFFFNFVPFSFLQVILLFFLLGTFFYWLKKHILPPAAESRRISTQNLPAKNKKVSFRFYPSLILLLLLIIILLSAVNRKESLLITLFNVGHGDLFLIETPQNEKIMIDTGPPAELGINFRFAALPYLKQRGINSLDWLIISHQHSDHYGGLQYVAQDIQIDNLMITANFFRDQIWQQLESFIDTTKTKLHLVSDTTHIPLTTLECKVLHPGSGFESPNSNEMSIVIRMALGNFSILFTGDIEAEAELHLLKNYYQYLDSYFIKVAHHGSRTSSSPLFIAAVDPQFAFIPAPRYSRFNLPHPETLNTLEFLGERLFISGIDGTLQIKTDGLTAQIRSLESERQIVVNF